MRCLTRAARAIPVAALVLSLGACGGAPSDAAEAAAAGTQPRNQLLGTWRMVSAVSDPGGPNERRPYGDRPNGLVTFNANGTFVEVLQDTEIPPFASGRRDGGSPEENTAAVTRALGQYGTYTVDAEGVFESDVIVGSTFPNRNGTRFVRPELTLTVRGDRLTEELASPGSPRLVIEFERVP